MQSINKWLSIILSFDKVLRPSNLLKLRENKIAVDKNQKVNPLPDENILGLPKLKAFADDKRNVTQNVKVVFHMIEIIVGKEENAGYRYVLLFPPCFQKAFSSSASKVVIVW